LAEIAAVSTEKSLNLRKLGCRAKGGGGGGGAGGGGVL